LNTSGEAVPLQEEVMPEATKIKRDTQTHSSDGD
jgi:hypothetical protein